MIRGLAIPYERCSPGGINGKPFCEIVSVGAFCESIKEGKCLKTGRSIYACRGHSAKKRDRLGSVEDGRLRIFETDKGVYFELDAKLPLLVTGVSVKFKARRWKEGPGLLYRLIKADLVHIAILTWPDRPAYPLTATQLQEVDKKDGKSIWLG